jgi:hypothetical protein
MGKDVNQFLMVQAHRCGDGKMGRSLEDVHNGHCYRQNAGISGKEDLPSWL